MAGTGCRISEALGQRWEDRNVEAGRVVIRGTKAAASVRTLVLPPWLSDRLAERATLNGTDGLLFASPGAAGKDTPRDSRNAARVLRQVLDDAGVPWSTPHVFRRTVATMIDQAGLSIVLAADVLGQADASLTARTYLGRRGSTAAAAAVVWTP